MFKWFWTMFSLSAPEVWLLGIHYPLYYNID